MKKIFEKENLCKCPECGMIVDRYEGCNFMTCASSSCAKKQVHFCYLCGDKLTNEDHLSHYKKDGPFGKTCDTLDERNGPIYEEEEDEF